MNYKKLLSFLICAALLCNSALATADSCVSQGAECTPTSECTESLPSEPPTSSENIGPAEALSPSSDKEGEGTPDVSFNTASEIIFESTQADAEMPDIPTEAPESTVPSHELNPDMTVPALPDLTEESEQDPFPSDSTVDAPESSAASPAKGEGTSDTALPGAPEQDIAVPVTEDATGHAVSESVISDMILENPVAADEQGNLSFPKGQLIDFIFPESIEGAPVTSIAAAAFQGCEYFKTVTIPASIEEIGASAFADCENLQMIILADRAEGSDIRLGENWNGIAEVIYEIQENQSSIEPTEASPEDVPAIEEAPSDPSDATEDASSESEPNPSPEEIEWDSSSETPSDTPLTPPVMDSSEETVIPDQEAEIAPEPLDSAAGESVPSSAVQKDAADNPDHKEEPSEPEPDLSTEETASDSTAVVPPVSEAAPNEPIELPISAAELPKEVVSPPSSETPDTSPTLKQEDASSVSTSVVLPTDGNES